jgi:hypothetical protein
MPSAYTCAVYNKMLAMQLLPTDAGISFNELVKLAHAKNLISKGTDKAKNTSYLCVVNSFIK